MDLGWFEESLWILMDINGISKLFVQLEIGWVKKIPEILGEIQLSNWRCKNHLLKKVSKN